MKLKKVDQDVLFNYTINDLTALFKAPTSTYSLWHQTGYLSFDPASRQEFSETEFQEFRFITTLFKSGLPLIFLDKLLAKLKKPYSFDISQIFYNWEKQEWENLNSFTPKNAIRLIQNLIENNEIEELKELQEKIAGFLSQENLKPIKKSTKKLI